MMTFIRKFLGSIIVFFDTLFAPTPIERDPAKQARFDEQTRNLSLYQFETCPFCVKVRRQIKRLALKIEIRDVKKTPRFAEELVVGGGQLQVPCLRIQETQDRVRWLYESSDINAYLESQFS